MSQSVILVSGDRPRTLGRARSALLGGLLVALFGCHSNEGHLIIVGGGLTPDNAAVYEHILSLGGEDATIGVLPTASGVYRESGRRAVQVLDVYSAEGRAEVIDITMDNPEEANNPEKAEQIARHRILFFTGGDQARILSAFRPESGDTLCFQRMQQLLPDGGVIAGTSAGAAMMSDPLIRGGRSADALRHGAVFGARGDAVKGVEIGPGMGFFPYGITGQHFLTRGRLGRMIIALEATGVARGYGVDDNNAIHVDLAQDQITALGRRGVLVVDMSDAVRDGMGLSGVRVSLLSHGDEVNGATGSVEPAEFKVEATVDAGLPLEYPIDPDVWGRSRVPALIEALALSPATHVAGTDGLFLVRFIEDDRTRYQIGVGGDPVTLTAVDVRVDIQPRDPTALPESAPWLVAGPVRSAAAP